MKPAGLAGILWRRPGRLRCYSIYTFEEMPDGKTRFTVNWRPHNATDDERATFDAGHASMTGGWSGTIDKLEAYLVKSK